MKQEPKIIQGGYHSDQRGSISFFNSFDMTQVKRFYVIQNKDTDVKRGWRGHKIEQRWFYAAEGKFKVQLVYIDNWDSPGADLPIKEFILSNDNGYILHVPSGYASCVQCLELESKLFVFADHGIDQAKLDDYLYPQTHFTLHSSESILQL